MIKRYADNAIMDLWSEENKLRLWLRTEMAVMEALVNLGKMPADKLREIERIFSEHPIDLGWWHQRDKEIKHDLNAFIDERLRFLPPELQQYFHKKITSYDTEESAFITILQRSCEHVLKSVYSLEMILASMARKYRYTIMNARTHGQEAEMQSFGKRCLAWKADLTLDKKNLEKSMQNLRFSKISGAIGNYGNIDPELEINALEEMDLLPYYGSTQIMPREFYAPIAQALSQIVMTINKIALAIRLGARSGRPIFQEPFTKKQKGSSAMPHKKNTIGLEQIEGMSRMAQGYAQMIQQNICTWEERAIEQSSVERIAWPDLFHVTIRSLKVISDTLSGLKIYPDNMMAEIIESRSCYASSEAKELLKELCQQYGIDNEAAYRIVQLAAFNVFEPADERKFFRDTVPDSLSHATSVLMAFENLQHGPVTSILTIIMKGELKISEQLDASEEQVAEWNDMLQKLFNDEASCRRWINIFSPEFLLRNEEILYEKILSE